MGPAAQQQQWPKVVFGPLGTPWAPWDPMWVGVMGAPQGQGAGPARAAWQQQQPGSNSMAAAWQQHQWWQQGKWWCCQPPTGSHKGWGWK